ARAGLTGPLPKAQALAEAKSWLRGLPAEEAQRLVAGLPGEARGSVRIRKSSPTPTPTKPFAHPYYWSGFILIGDPRSTPARSIEECVGQKTGMCGGTILTCPYQGETLQVRVLPHGVAFDGTVYPLLSAAGDSVPCHPR